MSINLKKKKRILELTIEEKSKIPIKKRFFLSIESLFELLIII